MNGVIMNDVSTNGVVAGDITPTELRRWALLEDDEEIREAMVREVMEEVEQSFASAGNQSEEDGEKRFVGQENAVLVPSTILISSLFEHVEAVCRVAGVGDASMHLVATCGKNRKRRYLAQTDRCSRFPMPLFPWRLHSAPGFIDHYEVPVLRAHASQIWHEGHAALNMNN